MIKTGGPRTHKFIVISFIIACVFHLGFVFFCPHETMSGDSYGYRSIAVNLLSGNGYAIDAGIPTARRMPGYPLFLAAFYTAFGTSPVPVQAAQAVIGALSGILAFLLAKELFDELTARISALAVGLYPVLITYSGILLTETIFTFFLLLTSLFFVRAYRSGDLKGYLLAGLSLGATILIRPDVIVMPLLFAAFIVTSSRAVLKSAARLAVFIAGVIILFAPWSIFNYSRFHTFFPGQSGGLGPLVRVSAEYAMRGADEYDKEAWTAMDDYLRDMGYYTEPEKVEKRLLHEGLRMIAARPDKYAMLIARRLPKFWLTSHSAMFGITRPNAAYMSEKRYGVIAAKSLLLALQVTILALAAAGLVTRLKLSGGMLFLAAMLLFPSLYVFLDGPSRHHVPFMPYFLIFAAAFIPVVAGMLHSKRTPS